MPYTSHLGRRFNTHSGLTSATFKPEIEIETTFFSVFNKHVYSTATVEDISLIYNTL